MMPCYFFYTEITGYGETGTTDQHTNNTASSSSDIVPIIVGSCAAGVFAIGTPVTILSIIAYFRKDKEDKDSTGMYTLKTNP